MKKHIVLLMSVLMVALGMGTSAFAQEVCPEGMMKVIQPDTQEVFCIGNIAPAQVPEVQAEIQEEPEMVPDAEPEVEPIEYYPSPRQHSAAHEFDPKVIVERKRNEALKRKAAAEEERKDIIHQELIKGGFAFDFGLGYAMYAAFHLRFMLGYHFAEKLNGVSFGIYSDLGLNFGGPNSVDWAVVPMLHLNGKIFRFSLGFGAGTFTIWSSDEEDDNKTGTWFQLKPEVHFDWFLSKRAYMGCGFDTPLIISNRKGGVTEVTPWFSMNIHVGFKY